MSGILRTAGKFPKYEKLNKLMDKQVKHNDKERKQELRNWNQPFKVREDMLTRHILKKHIYDIELSLESNQKTNKLSLNRIAKTNAAQFQMLIASSKGIIGDSMLENNNEKKLLKRMTWLQ